MNMLKDPSIARDIIIDNYQNPANKHNVDDSSYVSKHMASDSCIDDITVYMKLNNNTVEDVAFDGVGCTISTASTSIMTQLVKGKSIEEAKTICHNYMNMLDEKEYDENLLEEAIVFADVSKSANRIKCATIGWKGALSCLGENVDE